jgi:hypothetical protein
VPSSAFDLLAFANPFKAIHRHLVQVLLQHRTQTQLL